MNSIPPVLAFFASLKEQYNMADASVPPENALFEKNDAETRFYQLIWTKSLGFLRQLLYFCLQ
jgi:hypothetical protein